MIGPPLSVKGFSFPEGEGQVCYHYGKDAQEMERMVCLEFIAQVTPDIPDKWQVTLRYRGL